MLRFLLLRKAIKHTVTANKIMSVKKDMEASFGNGNGNGNNGNNNNDNDNFDNQNEDGGENNSTLNKAQKAQHKNSFLELAHNVIETLHNVLIVLMRHPVVMLLLFFVCVIFAGVFVALFISDTEQTDKMATLHSTEAVSRIAIALELSQRQIIICMDQQKQLIAQHERLVGHNELLVRQIIKSIANKDEKLELPIFEIIETEEAPLKTINN